MSVMKIRFWGVRGSIASPGEHTAYFGGNTSSVEVQCGSTTILLDAGTGLRSLGMQMLAEQLMRSLDSETDGAVEHALGVELR